MKYLLLVFFFSTVFAQDDKVDRVILESGGEIVGTVVAEDAAYIKIDVAFAYGGSGEMVFTAGEVRRIERSSADRPIARTKPEAAHVDKKQKEQVKVDVPNTFITSASIESFRKLENKTLQDAVGAFGKNYIVGPAHPSTGTDPHSLFKNKQKYYVWRNKDGTGVAMKKEDNSDSVYGIVTLK